MENEPITNLSALCVNSQNSCGKVLEENKQFFIETLYGKTWCETFIGDE